MSTGLFIPHFVPRVPDFRIASKKFYVNLTTAHPNIQAAIPVAYQLFCLPEQVQVGPAGVDQGDLALVFKQPSRHVASGES